MRTIDAFKKLAEADKNGRHVYSKRELSELFKEDGRCLTNTLSMLCKEEILRNVYKGIYLYLFSEHLSGATYHEVVKRLRPGKLMYESGASAASKWSLISQIPTTTCFVTDGKSGVVETNGMGVFEFKHKSLSPAFIEQKTIDRSAIGELPLANQMQTLLDLKKSPFCWELAREQYNKDHGGIDGTVRYTESEDDDTWEFLDEKGLTIDDLGQVKL